MAQTWHCTETDGSVYGSLAFQLRHAAVNVPPELYQIRIAMCLALR
jgi:hypothetical protein